MKECLQCRRRLLSHASAKCNWCGAVIGDADYQAQAQSERDAFFTHQAQRDAQSLNRIDSINAYGALSDAFTAAPPSNSKRRGTLIRPLTYENQPQAMQAMGQTPGVQPVAADKNCENELPHSDQPKIGPPGRFQHLEL